MSKLPGNVPATQYAVQLIGPDKLALNAAKEVHQPGDYQILARVEAVGLCFSDLKLLHQFSAHPRKGKVVSGVAPEVLTGFPSYRPGDLPTVPGHETVATLIAVGGKVKRHKVGERVMVQADWRLIRTAESNAAFGYNFEGALQEYILLDERIVIEPGTGERYLIPADKDLSASAVALVEPWACVENSYANDERRTVKAGGKLLVVADAGASIEGLSESFAPAGPCASLTALCADEAQKRTLEKLGLKMTLAGKAQDLPNEAFDDVIYFGATKETLDVLNDKLAAGGIFNLVLGGRKIGRGVSVGVGRVHYGGTRWTGTVKSSAAEGYASIPANGELRPGDRVVIIGAGGPMGQMHTLRSVALGIPGVSVIATDVDDARLEALRLKAQMLAEKRGTPLRMVNTKTQALTGKFSYFALMAPVGALVAQAISDSADGALINIFAGIPAPTKQDLDLDTYVAHRCFMFGTSGSRIEDMKSVLRKVASGRLDTNSSVDAVSGMAGAADGIEAVKNRTLAGKIIVYPSLHEMPLIPLSRLTERYPAVAKKLDHGLWCKAAEEELLKSLSE